MQRWSIGQLRSMHGEHSTSLLVISALREKGRVVSGFVGPKMAIVSVPTAGATCARPMSFEINRSTTLSKAAASPISVFPVRSTGALCAVPRTSPATSESSLEPTSSTLRCACNCNKSLSLAKWSAGHLLATEFVEPTPSATVFLVRSTP